MTFVLFACRQNNSSRSIEKFGGLFFYFTLQCSASFVFLLSSLSEDLCGFFPPISVLSFFSVLFKLGLPPFHFWVYKFCKHMSVFETFLVIVIQKIPFILFCFSFNWHILCVVIVLVSILGCLFVWESKRIISLLVSSGIYIFLWFFFIISYRFLFFARFYLLYSFFVLKGVVLKAKTFLEVCCEDSYLILLLILVFLAGLPPVSFFFFKFFSLFSLSFYSPSLVILR